MLHCTSLIKQYKKEVIKLKIVAFIIISLFIGSTCYGEGIVNTYISDTIESEVSYHETMTPAEKRIISSTTVIEQEEDQNTQVKQLIKDKIIPDQTDVFEPNSCIKLRKDINQNIKTRRVISNHPRPAALVKSPR